MAWIDDLNNLPDRGAVYRFQPTTKPTSKKETKKGRGGTLTSLISEGGALGGAAAGAAIGSVVPVVGTTIGGVLGGTLGAFGGRLAENKVRDDRLGVGDAAKEAALTGLLGAPIRTAKYGITAAKTFKDAKKAKTLADALKTENLESTPVAKVSDVSDIVVSMANKQGTLANPLDKMNVWANPELATRLAGSSLTSNSGSALATALTAGAKAADAPGKLSMIRGRIANKAGEIRDDAALKNFKLNDSTWITKFQQKVGEDPGAFAARLGFATSTPKDVAEKFYNPLQDVYTSYLQQVPAITKQDVAGALNKRIAEYAKSDVADVRAMGEKLKSEADTLLKRLPDNFSALDARAKKAAFQAAVDEKLMDTTGKLANNTNKQIADVFRTLINDKADAAGIVIDPATLPIPGIKATNIRELGNELRGIKEFADKAAIKQNVGRGKNPIGLTSAIGATGGGAMAGIPGAAIGAGVTTLANSQAGRRAEFSVAQRLANMTGSQTNPLRQGVGIGARGATGASIAEALASGYSSPLEPNMSDNTQMSINTAATPNIANMTQQYTNSVNNASMQQPQQIDPATIQMNVQQILAAGGTLKDAQEYVSLVAALQEVGQSQQASVKPPTGEQQKYMNNALSGLQDIQFLRDTIARDPQIALKSNVPGGSLARSLTGTSEYEAAKNNIMDVLARLRTGAAITKDEQTLFMRYLPSSFDSPEVANAKLDRMQELFQRFAQPNQLTPSTVEEAML